jgi:hypothetical protein
MNFYVIFPSWSMPVGGDEMAICPVRLDIEGGAPAAMLSPVKMLQLVPPQRRRNAVQLDAQDAPRDIVHVSIQ